MKELGRILRTFKESEAVKRIARKPGQPIRDYPTYTIPEAALFLGIPTRTLRYWLLDHPIWEIANPDRKHPLLSFRDLAQAYYVELVRKHFQLNLSDTRRVIAEASKESKALYPLLRKNILVFAKHVCMDKPARGRQPHRIIDLTQYRQLYFPEMVGELAKRINWDSHNEPIQLFPWRHWAGVLDERQPVCIDSNVMSGRLVITGTRIPVQTIVARSKKESFEKIAKDYELSTEIIQQAVSHLVQAKAA